MSQLFGLKMQKRKILSCTKYQCLHIHYQLNKLKFSVADHHSSSKILWMFELNIRATPLLKSHKQLDCTNCAQISKIQCNINYSACFSDMLFRQVIQKSFYISSYTSYSDMLFIKVIYISYSKKIFLLAIFTGFPLRYSYKFSLSVIISY